MEDIVQFDFPTDSPKIIKVIGVGGGGGNAVNHMYREGIHDVTFVLCNTDNQALKDSPVPVKLQLGKEGLGAGNRPARARKAAEESIEDIKNMLNDGTKMVFITAGMGGGTGTGAAPIIAQTAKEMDILTIGIVTIPFRWEGDKKIDQALDGVEEISKHVDALLVINNEKLSEIYSELSVDDAFDKADDTLSVAAKSIAEIITLHGKVNLDFNDVKTVLKDGGVAIMSTGYGEGDNRVSEAIKNAQHSPLLNNNDIFNSKKVLLNISYSAQYKLMMSEMDEVKEFMNRFSRDFETKFGMAIDDKLEQKVKITLLATGFGIQDIHMKEMDDRITQRTAEEQQRLAELEEEEEQRRNRREVYYGKDANARSQRSRRRHIYLFNPEDMDNADIISMVENSPTYLRDKSTLNSIKMKAEQKSRARADALKKRHNVDLSVYDDFKKTLVQPIDFLGYTDMSARAKVLGIMQEGKGSVPAVTGPATVEVILDRTPFYAQAGGQLADQGEILSDDGAVLEVDDVQKPIKDLIVHQCRLTEGTLVVGAEVNANIDLDRRGAIARAHTATHMVHKALREELGPQATQRGSEDAPNRLRFDFQWSSAPSKDAMNSVEARVNEKLRENLAVTTQEMKFDDAIALGAMHLFGEKYGDVVRVVSIGEDGWSRELCGGTHIDHVGKIGAINIMSEASIGSGVRRVDAVVGESAYEFNAREHALVSQLSDMVNARPDELADRVNALLARLKESDRRLATMYESQLAASVPALVSETKASQAPVKVAAKNVEHFGSFDALRKTVLDVRGQLGEEFPVVVALAGVNEEGKPMVAVATNEAARKQGIKAGDLVRGASKILGGGGGGKPDFAQGGGADATKINEALEALANQAMKG